MKPSKRRRNCARNAVDTATFWNNLLPLLLQARHLDERERSPSPDGIGSTDQRGRVGISAKRNAESKCNFCDSLLKVGQRNRQYMKNIRYKTLEHDRAGQSTIRSPAAIRVQVVRRSLNCMRRCTALECRAKSADAPLRDRLSRRRARLRKLQHHVYRKQKVAMLRTSELIQH